MHLFHLPISVTCPLGIFHPDRWMTWHLGAVLLCCPSGATYTTTTTTDGEEIKVVPLKETKRLVGSLKWNEIQEETLQTLLLMFWGGTFWQFPWGHNWESRVILWSLSRYIYKHLRDWHFTGINESEANYGSGYPPATNPDIYCIQTCTEAAECQRTNHDRSGFLEKEWWWWMLLSDDLKLPQSNLPAFRVTEQRWPLALRCPIVADAGRFHCKKPGSKTRQGKESTKESHVQFNLPSQNIYTIFVAP